MQTAKSREFRVLKARNRAEQFNLCTVLQLGLEADHVPQRAKFVVLPQLHHGIGPSALREFGRHVMRIVQPHWLHRAKTQGFDAA